MDFLTYSNYLEELATNSSRNFMTERISALLSQLGSGEMSFALYLLQGRVAPEYEPLEFNYSGKSVVKLIQELADYWGVKFNAKDEYARLGDCGDLAQELLILAEKNTSAKHQLIEVYSQLRIIAETSGAGSSAEKSRIASQTIAKLSAQEAKYFCRILAGDLRLGVSNKTILDAISWCKSGGKGMRASLDRAYGMRADIGLLAEEVILRDQAPEGIHLAVGTPLSAQLVERESDTNSIIARIPRPIVQAKYDGLRLQFHYDEAATNKVHMFSRNMEPLTDMFPDLASLVEAFPSHGIKSVVLDGEVIGFDESTNEFLPFQQTSQRRRKHGVDALVDEIPVSYFIFDILYLNGRDLTQTALRERLVILKSLNLSSIASKLSPTESVTFNDSQQLEKHFRAELDRGLEGVIAKDPESKYSPGTRCYDWIKLKANTFTDLKDTVDAVVMGYYSGRGQRAKFGIGGFLVGVFNEEKGVYQTIAKVGSGVKEEEWEQYRRQLDAIRVSEVPANYEIRKELMPAVVVHPEIVVEIDADEITLSKLHTAEGLSLRFPRLKIWGRDKGPEDTTKVGELRKLYEMN